MSVTVERSLGPSATPELIDLYETYEWWADREEEPLRRALAATDEVVALRDEETDDLIAAARALTDYTYYAMVYDVIVREGRRGEGLGDELMAALVTHPPLSDVDLGLVAREGLVPFYEACGFEEIGAVDYPDGEPETLRPLVFRRDE
ncbi:GNAT family N-acetyltransferase [Halosimplex aquaticum]|uniref:GNAT family N-acetyltransferase n=1 Tax=Halosimplex aquaticum TaxID=3026162 RepID=A0ABD5XY76_9EURY|nr:GNAT family N-acetyltransferase [Halosimplex aquaticum]